MYIPLELVIRILFDIPDWKADCLYVFAAPADNQGSVFEKLRTMPKDFSGVIAVSGASAGNGYPGGRAWIKKIGAPKTEKIPLLGKSRINTLTEAQALISLAKKRKWKRIIVVASPFHQLRAFMTTVSVALREFPELKIYGLTGLSLPWRQKACHSQGTLRDTRSRLICHEEKRISIYCKKGDIVSPQKVLSYLDSRD